VFVGGPFFFPFADVAVLRSENTSGQEVDSSYFIIERGIFLGYI